MPRLVAQLALLCAVLLVASAAAAQPTLRAPDLSTAEAEALRAGSVLVNVEVDGRITRGRVMALVDGSAEEVWEIIADFARQDEWVPDMYDARIVSGSGDEVVASACMHLPFPLRDREYTLRIRYELLTLAGVDSRVSTWTYIDGNMDENAGYWLVQPWQDAADRTLVTYEFEVGSGVRAPDALERRVTERTIPGILEGLRERHATLY